MDIDWIALFAIDLPLLELFLRGTVTYLAVLCLLRFSRREVGGLALPDFLVIVLISDSASNALVGEYHSISSGVVVVATIIFWAQLLDLLSYRFTVVRKILQPAPVPVVRRGLMLKKNMRHEFVEKEEVFAELRKANIENISDVKLMCIESDGKFSIVTTEKRSH